MFGRARLRMRRPAEKELCLNRLAVGASRDSAHVREPQSARCEIRNDLMRKRLPVVQLDKRRLNQDLIDDVQRRTGALQHIQLEALNIDLEQARSRDVAAEIALEPIDSYGHLPHLLCAREDIDLLPPDREQRRGIVLRRNVQAGVNGRRPECQAVEVDTVCGKYLAGDSDGLGERLEADYPRMLESPEREQGKLPSRCSCIDHGREIESERHRGMFE